MSKRFSHLHIHTGHSLLKGTGKIDNWYKKAQKRNIGALAITELGNMNSAMDAYLESLKYADVKNIFGIQILLVKELEASVQEDHLVLLAKNERGYKNLLRLSKYSWTKGFDLKRQTPRVDYDTLNKYRKGIFALSGSYSGPVGVSFVAGYKIAEEALLELKDIYGKNLLIELQLMESDETTKLNRALIQMSKAHGLKCVITNDCHYVNKGEDKLADFVGSVSKLSVKYIKQRQAVGSKQKWLKSYKQLNETRKESHGYITEFAFNTYVDNTNAVADECNVDIPIGKHVIPEYPIDTHPLYKKKFKDKNDLLMGVAKRGFKEKVLDVVDDVDKRKAYKKRFKYEACFLKDADFVDYFLIIDDIVRFARLKGIEAGGARGSAAGSLIAFCMFTEVDPMRFDLIFERFLNPGRVDGLNLEVEEKPYQYFLERLFPNIDIGELDDSRVLKKAIKNKPYKSRVLAEWRQFRPSQKAYALYLAAKKKKFKDPNGSWVLYALKVTEKKPVEDMKVIKGSYPDVDLDFEKIRRPDIKKYIIDKYGENNVCTIGTYGTFKVKGLIRDIQRVLKAEEDGEYLDYALLPVTKNKFEKFYNKQSFELTQSLDKDDIDDLDLAIKGSKAFAEFYKNYPYTVDFYFKRLNGLPKSMSRHAAGVIITPSKVSNWLPVRTQKLRKDEGGGRVLVSQWDGDGCEKRGLLKLDILGIKTLNVFKYAREIIKEDSGVEVDLEKVDLEDPRVLKLFSKSETDGVFQFKSDLQRGYLKKIDVNAFEDLITINALLRPGPREANAHVRFERLKNGKEEPEYDHKKLKKYLKKTMGLYVYQEDIMRTVSVLGGLTLSEADNMRAAIKYGDKVKLNEIRDKFVIGCTKNDLTEKKAKGIWKKILGFLGYGFNRCIVGKSKIDMVKDRRTINIKSLYKRFNDGERLFVKSYDKKKNVYVDNTAFLHSVVLGAFKMCCLRTR